ncbi:MAG: nucleoside recognition domain-containing protein [Bacillota bacterium]
MINLIWLTLVIGGVTYGALTGNIDRVTSSALASAKSAVETVLGFVGVMCLWLGLMKVADRSGLMRVFSKLVSPAVHALFPDVPRGHPAMGALVMNIGGNLLGMGSAATPFGLKAMEQLQALNPDPGQASNAMCRFVVLNTSGLTLVPAAVIGLRSSLGSRAPAEIVGAVFLATVASTLVALASEALLRGPGRR